MSERRNWTREETILAFDLYCRTPFGKIDKNNPDIIELAKLIGRTPSAVGLKMANLAHYDPELQKRHISGMSNTSKLDGEIFNEFSNDWTDLSYQAQLIRANMLGENIEETIDLGDIDKIPPGEYRERMTKTRVGQYFFRMAVLTSYRNRCCITGMEKPELLVASHIKPWKDSDEKTERTNPSNGLCLNSLHDKAFDRGFITIDNRYRIVMSSKLKDVRMDAETRDWFWSYEGKEIILPEKFLPDKDFIQYHNDVVFKG